MVNLANELAFRGHPVDLVLAEAAGPYLAEVAQGVGLVDLRARSVMRSLPRLAGHLRATRPDVIISALSHANAVSYTHLHRQADDHLYRDGRCRGD